MTGRVVDSYTNIYLVKMFVHHDIEINYAKKVIEKARETFQQKMQLYTCMEISLGVQNGFLIIGIVSCAVRPWIQSVADIGLIAVATALTLRMNAVSGWIIFAVSNFYRNLGVVAEGMQIITQPIALLDKPNAKPLVIVKGELELCDLSHHYGKMTGGLIISICLLLQAKKLVWLGNLRQEN